MRRHITVVLSTLMLVALVAAVAVALPGPSTPVAAQDTDDASQARRFITVVGQGKASVTPDIAVLSLGAETQDAAIREAIDANDAIMADVVAALSEAGVAEEDIQTSNYSIYFDEGFRGPEMQTEPVYRVSNMVTVKIRDLETVGEVLDAVIEAGANRIYGVSFTLDEWATAESEARADAMANATDRATQLADLSGTELGEILSVSEVVGGASPYYFGSKDVALASGLGGGGSVAPGQLEVSMNIQVTYAVQ